MFCYFHFEFSNVCNVHCYWFYDSWSFHKNLLHCSFANSFIKLNDDEPESSIAKGYVRQFFAIMLEGVLILVLLSMAGALLGDVILSDSAGSVVMILLKIFVFCFAFVK